MLPDPIPGLRSPDQYDGTELIRRVARLDPPEINRKAHIARAVGRRLPQHHMRFHVARQHAKRSIDVEPTRHLCCRR